MSFNLSHSLRHTCTLSPVTGGGQALRVTADEIPRRLSCGNMAANSWSVPFFILSVTAASHTSPTTNPLLLHLSLFVHPWIISLFSLSHCLLSICRLFRRSLSLWFSPWSCEATTSHCCPSFLETKNTVNYFELFHIQSPQKTCWLSTSLQTTDMFICITRTVFLISYHFISSSEQLNFCKRELTWYF